MNNLAVYFSASGVTKDVANILANKLKASLLEIEPKEKYTNADLDWTNKFSRSSKENEEESIRPAIVKKDIDTGKYDKVFIGFPIWWGVAPRVVNTFIEENNLANSDIYVFATSGGSGIDMSFNDLKNKYPHLHFVSAKLLTRFNTEEEISSWLNI